MHTVVRGEAVVPLGQPHALRAILVDGAQAARLQVPPRGRQGQDQSAQIDEFVHEMNQRLVFRAVAIYRIDRVTDHVLPGRPQVGVQLLGVARTQVDERPFSGSRRPVRRTDLRPTQKLRAAHDVLY
ncbi:T32.1 [Tupaiid betaherpesvirus 1]|uniref:T32.1 n=1 Tax=Tupaiid herpesvirus 1 (strain 1) TaxID=10397 RepID=Q91TR0_TUHV1|nr:T32.1 [Tupaiid betaherpesvirus 1]AAK57077.1 T32.1 [Tupaiid betaherpesvirus 1]